MGRKMKGQMFIIAAIFMIVTIVIIRNMVGSQTLTEENRFQESRFPEKTLRNVQNEFRQLAALAALQADANRSGMEYLRNFSLQLRDDTDIAVMYIYIVANGTNQRYSATIGNYLQDRMNITFNATSSSPGSRLFIIEDRANLTREYNSTINGTISINVTYTSQNLETTERFNITDNTKSNIFLFTDITVKSDDLYARGKDFYNWSWPV